MSQAAVTNGRSRVRLAAMTMVISTRRTARKPSRLIAAPTVNPTSTSSGKCAPTYTLEKANTNAHKIATAPSRRSDQEQAKGDGAGHHRVVTRHSRVPFPGTRM